jgi:hypothetical protein
MRWPRQQRDERSSAAKSIIKAGAPHSRTSIAQGRRRGDDHTVRYYALELLETMISTRGIGAGQSCVHDHSLPQNICLHPESIRKHAYLSTAVTSSGGPWRSGVWERGISGVPGWGYARSCM